MFRVKKAKAGIILVILLGLITNLSGAILNVPSVSYPTIQSAIDAANTGDEIIVSPDIYHENIDFQGKDITLTGTDPDDPSVVASTVINGDGLSTVTFSGTETSACRLEGMKITSTFTSGIVTVDQDIEVNTTWTSEYTYYINSSIRVMPCAKLTIEPGTIVKLNTGVSLTGIGNIVAKGMAENLIIFTSKNDDSVGRVIPSSTGTPSARDWSNLVPGQSSEVEFCRISYAYSGIQYQIGGISPFNPVKNNIISNCKYGISVLLWIGSVFSPIEVSNNLIYNCSDAGLYVDCSFPQAPFNVYLRNNTIDNCANYGIFYYVNDLQDEPVNSEIFNNLVTRSNNGIYCDTQHSQSLIEIGYNGYAQCTTNYVCDLYLNMYEQVDLGNSLPYDVASEFGTHFLNNDPNTGALLIDAGNDPNQGMPGFRTQLSLQTDDPPIDIGFHYPYIQALPGIGGIYGNGTEATISKCLITGNRAYYGGGIYDCDGRISACEILDNTANISGGGLADCDGAIVNCIVAGNSAENGGGLENCDGDIINCTVTDNAALDSGGGLNNCNGSGKNIANNIIWANTGGQIENYTGAAVEYNCIQNWSGIGNISDNPKFVDADGPDDIVGTIDDNDYHLADDSPCIDAGQDSYVSSGDVDIDGDARINVKVDMGADEYYHEIPGGITIYYVDASATSGNNDGSSWTDAYLKLQDALDEVHLAAWPFNIRIWVAEGYYYPDEDLIDNDNNGVLEHLYGQSEYFDIRTGGSEEVLKLYGGFPAGGAASLSARDWYNNETILSGDIDQDQVLYDPDNSHHVALCGAVTVDGLVFEHGYADNENGLYGTDPKAGGAIVSISNTILVNCNFRNNYAVKKAGAIYQHQGNPEIENCIFKSNQAGADGGGAIYYHLSPSPKIKNSLFEKNHVSPRYYTGGGAILAYGHGTKPEIYNCVFYENTVTNNLSRGGAIYCDYRSNPVIVNCTFVKNQASYGGAIATNDKAPDGSRPGVTIRNTILWGNSAYKEGHQLYVGNYAGGSIDYSAVEPGSSSIRNGSSDFNSTNSNGTSSDPDFIASDLTSVDLDGQDNKWATSDDGLALENSISPCIDTGVLSFKRFPSDPVSSTFYVTDIDITGSDRTVDGDGDTIDEVDMGAYEYPAAGQ